MQTPPAKENTESRGKKLEKKVVFSLVDIVFFKKINYIFAGHIADYIYRFVLGESFIKPAVFVPAVADMNNKIIDLMTAERKGFFNKFFVDFADALINYIGEIFKMAVKSVFADTCFFTDFRYRNFVKRFFRHNFRQSEGNAFFVPDNVFIGFSLHNVKLFTPNSVKFLTKQLNYIM